MILKIFAQKKAEKSYDSYNMCSNFSGFRCSPPDVVAMMTVRNQLTGCSWHAKAEVGRYVGQKTHP